MIPKKIHYCWFGGNPKPLLAKKCMRSWKKICPDYEIIEWNEDNFDLSSAPLYVKQAYSAQKWAFVSDYVRLKVIYDHGGIYLDTDVQLIRDPGQLLEYKAYFGFEDGILVNTGLGFGAEKGAAILQELMNDYEREPFILGNGKYDTTTCPAKNTAVLLKHGLIQNDELQVLDGDIMILPHEYLSPRGYNSVQNCFTERTISIHWFAASWYTDEEQKRKKLHKKRAKKNILIHTPNRILLRILGREKYEKLKNTLHGGHRCL